MKQQQHLVNVRVRPQRVAVLIDRNAGEEELQLGFSFLSKIWGGRYAQILAVDRHRCDEVSEFRLSRSRPDYVYGINLDDGEWSIAVDQACQPRGYGGLTQEFVDGINTPHPEDFFLVDHALLELSRRRERPSRKKRQIHLVSCDGASPMAAYCSAVFGKHHADLRKELYDVETTFAGSTVDFIRLVTQLAKDRSITWCDITAYELNPRISGGHGELSPTIVLVDSRIEDLSYFWSMRALSTGMTPAWIIPVPLTDSFRPEVWDALREWLLALNEFGAKANYCQVTSVSVSESDCSRFAAHMQELVKGSHVEYFDYEPVHVHLPIVVPVEYETTWPIDVSGRKIRLVPPRPKLFEDLGTPRAWVVDVVKDLSTGRSFKELVLPPGRAMRDVLNGPCPPKFMHSALPVWCDGVDSINVRCSDAKDLIHFWRPTSEEVLSESLREGGLEPLADEKRSVYLPVIKRFGGIHRTASAFVGQSGDVLKALSHATYSPRELQSRCKLGNGTLKDDSYIKRVESLAGRATDRMKRIILQRFGEYARHYGPDNLDIKSFLEFWTDRNVLVRQWRVGPCKRCRQQYFVPSLNIQRPIVCNNCGSRWSLSGNVPVGYTMQRAVAHAVDEGLIPVALTGRFLHNLTSNGFMWLPGFKFERGEVKGDIDLVAACDGHLILCECKNLESTPLESNPCPASLATCPRNTPTSSHQSIWEAVADQFLTTASVANECKASVVVFASLATEYPQSFKDKIAAALRDKIPYLLLTYDDLQRGHRKVKRGGHESYMFWHDVIPQKFPLVRPPRIGGPRQIQFGWGTHSS